MQSPKVLLIASLLALNLSSCGYHSATADEKTTIAIPYVAGDNQGQLTAELIHQLVNSGLYDYVKQDGDLTLKVTLLDDKTDTIGFQYNLTHKKGKIERNLMPQENRRFLTAQVTLMRGTEEVAMGPLNITSSAEYDFIDVNSLKEVSFINAQGKREKTISFSLGQLDSVEGAQDAARTPLYRQLAQKIVLALQRNMQSTRPSDD